MPSPRPVVLVSPTGPGPVCRKLAAPARMPLVLAAGVADVRARAAARGTRCFPCCPWARASEVTFAYLSPRIAGRRDAPGVCLLILVVLQWLLFANWQASVAGPRELAEAWRRDLRTLCEQAGLELSREDEATLDQWGPRRGGRRELTAPTRRSVDAVSQRIQGRLVLADEPVRAPTEPGAGHSARVAATARAGFSRR